MSNKYRHMQEVQEVLRQLGATTKYTGYFYLVEGICLAMDDKSRLLSITKEIYQELAMQHHRTAGSVERNMRTVIHMVWKKKPGVIEEVTGYPFDERPSVGRFMGSVVESLMIREAQLLCT